MISSDTPSQLKVKEQPPASSPPTPPGFNDHNSLGHNEPHPKPILPQKGHPNAKNYPCQKQARPFHETSRADPNEVWCCKVAGDGGAGKKF
jgi:hypothetical protein